MNPFEELQQFYPDIIRRMGKRFSSHEFILALAHEHQGLYIQALAQYTDGKAPFKTVHAQLAKGLVKFDQLVFYIGDEPSPDIFGHLNSAALWGKK